MFWKSKRRREDEEFVMGMMRAAAEGENRAKINRALGSIGQQLPPEPDNTQYSIAAACAVVTAVMEKAGKPPRSADDDDRFVGGIFAFVASDHISRIVGAQFEMVSSAAVVFIFFDLRHAAEAGLLVREVGNAYNKLAHENGPLLQAIGQNIAKWINEPTDGQLSKLAALFGVCRENISGS